ncbi:MAG: SDR family oxidoreductase [Proteobacteria bacterium]|nr:SDR family oxidoreductase [Pseudomonadota bacterium]
MDAYLQGKVALISGAATGIGAGIAELFAQHGAAVVIGDVQAAAGEATAKRIRDAGGKASFVLHDVADEGQWVAIVARAIKDFGGLDIVVNNAGIEKTCPLADVELVDVQKILAVNVTGTILGHKHAIRAMRPGGSAAAAVECGRFGYGIRVNSIHPGLVETDMGNHLVDDFVRLGVFPNRSVADEQVLATYPIGRTGVPKDVANAALFLASELSSWMTGTEIVVDGGLTIS